MIRALIIWFQTAQTDLSNYRKTKDKDSYEMSMFDEPHKMCLAAIVAKMKPLIDLNEMSVWLGDMLEKH